MGISTTSWRALCTVEARQLVGAFAVKNSRCWTCRVKALESAAVNMAMASGWDQTGLLVINAQRKFCGVRRVGHAQTRHVIALGVHAHQSSLRSCCSCDPAVEYGNCPCHIIHLCRTTVARSTLRILHYHKLSLQACDACPACPSDWQRGISGLSRRAHPKMRDGVGSCSGSGGAPTTTSLPSSPSSAR